MLENFIGFEEEKLEIKILVRPWTNQVNNEEIYEKNEL